MLAYRLIDLSRVLHRLVELKLTPSATELVFPHWDKLQVFNMQPLSQDYSQKEAIIRPQVVVVAFPSPFQQRHPNLFQDTESPRSLSFEKTQHCCVFVRAHHTVLT